MKLRFAVGDGEVSRRELFTAAWPRYEVIPYVDTERCAGYEACGLCINSCPLKAIQVDGGEVAIAPALCSGGGACVELCPSRAVIYPTFTLEKLDREMEELLLSSSVIAAVCQNCVPSDRRDKLVRSADDVNVGILSVPCLAMVSPWLMLRAFDRGAGGFALISSGDGCRSGYEEARWQSNVRFVQGLLHHWNIEGERLKLFDLAQGEIDSLSEFAREVAGLGNTSLAGHPLSPLPDEGLRLPALLWEMNHKLRFAKDGIIPAGDVPLGMVALDSSKCTGCSLCAADCPTGAMAVFADEETGDYRLLFEHARCVACGKCTAICPEECLTLEHVLDWCAFSQPAAVLFEDAVVRCVECGEPIGTRAMLDSVKAKLTADGQELPDRFELCPPCKVKAQFRSWGTVTEQMG